MVIEGPWPMGLLKMASAYLADDDRGGDGSGDDDNDDNNGYGM